MEYKKMKVGSLQLVLLALILVSTSLVSAFSVGFESTELRLYPGESYESSFSLQNYGTDAKDITVEATLEEGAQYLSFPQGTRIDVVANNNAAAPVRITVPSNAKVGDKYPIKVLFNVVAGNEVVQDVANQGTTIGFAFSYRRTVDLIVVAPVTEQDVDKNRTSASYMTWIWILIALVVVAIIVWLILRRKNN